ncbi:MAG: autotransporter domain-containing protein [Lysobacter sp.]|nr:autotransporter domain-containing protein [Lysobacter sp.]
MTTSPAPILQRWIHRCALALMAMALSVAVLLPVKAMAQPALTLSPETLPNASTQVYYFQFFSASGGVAPYTHRISAGALPPGIFLFGNFMSGVPSIAGTYSFSITATDRTSPVPLTVTRDYALVVEQTPFVIDEAMPPVATAGRNYSHSITARGGIKPYAFRVESGALPLGLTLASDGSVSGIPMVAGTFDINVVVTDSTSGTPSTAIRSFRFVVELPVMSVSPERPSHAAVGSPYAMSLGAVGGKEPYLYALTSGVLPEGLELQSNGTITGVPEVVGSYEIIITATDGSTGYGPITGSRAYTMVVEPPRLVLDTGVLPVATAAQPYIARLGVSNGVAPYEFTLGSGTLPPGLTLAEDGTISGIPARPLPPPDFSQYAFVFNVVDANRRSATFSMDMTVIDTPIQIGPAVVPDGIAGVTEYLLPFTAENATAPFAFALQEGALPQGLRFDPDTATLSGIPTESGSFAFTLQLTDAENRIVARQYAFTIAAPTLALTSTALSAGTTGVAYRHLLSAGGGAEPYRFRIIEGAMPPGMALSVDGEISGTTHQAGTFPFAIEVASATRQLSVQALTLQINPPASMDSAPVITTTVAPVIISSRTVTMVAGVAATIELTEGATGGPFTAANVVSLSPANAGTVSIDHGGSGTNTHYALRFAPAPDFSGVATVQYTLGNSGAISAPATIVFTVVPRPDPAHDPEVLGLLDAQAHSARSFATAQIGNVRQRLERLHGAGDGRYGFSDGLTFASNGGINRCASRVATPPGETCARPLADDVVVSSRHRSDYLFGTWVAGTLGSGERDARNGREAMDFETRGVSGGGDMRIGDGYAGASVGYGRDRTWVGDDDTRSDAQAYTLSVYGGYAPGDVFFIDGMLGYQSLHYDLRRSPTATAGDVKGRRNGRQWFAALTAGADLERGRWQFTPYGRFEFVRATLDGYREQGDPVYALRYDDQTLRSTSANLGLRVDYRRTMGWGMFAPQLRLEYQRDVERDGAATLHYADWTQGPAYRADVPGIGRSRLEIGLGALFENRAQWTFAFGYRGLFDDDGSDHGLTFDIQHEF